MIQPEETLFLKDILCIKDEVNIKNPRLPVMKGVHNTNGAALCLPFLPGGHCESTGPCGYHLQVNDPNRLRGKSNEDCAPFHYFLVASNKYNCLITAASQNSNMDPSSSPYSSTDPSRAL